MPVLLPKVGARSGSTLTGSPIGASSLEWILPNASASPGPGEQKKNGTGCNRRSTSLCLYEIRALSPSSPARIKRSGFRTRITGFLPGEEVSSLESKTLEIRPKADQYKGGRKASRLTQPRRSSLVDTLNICHTYPPP